MLFSAIISNFDELLYLLDQLTDEQYNEPCPDLGNATIGDHYRHVIEIFSCLLEHYGSGNVNYDQRDRDRLIATRMVFALEKIDWIKVHLQKPDKEILLQQTLDQRNLIIRSNYFRELLYNLEHSIHHQALIKIAVQKYDNIVLPLNFGVAPSTIAYKERKQCAL